MTLPRSGRGELYLSTSAPAAGRAWSEGGTRREPRQLNGGVPAPQVAQWAGHSVDVLLRVYAKCIAGHEDAVRRRVEDALRQGKS